jgi:type I restriction enzyme S subunit
MNNLKELPKDWKWVELQDISEITSSRRIFQSDYVQEGVPFYRTKEIKELSEGKNIKIELFISTEKYDAIREKNPVPKIGDILLSAVGTIGVSYIIKNEDCFYFKDGNLIWVRNLKNVNAKYLDYNFAHFIKFQQSILTSGSAYNALTIVKLKKYLVPLPPLSTQQAIVSKIEELFSELDKGVENLKTAQQQLKVYRQAVLKWAFEGKLTNGINQDANDLPDDHDLAMVAEPSEVYQTAKSLNHGFNDLRDDHDLKTGVNKTLEKNQKNQANQTNQGADNGGLPKGWKWVTFKEVSIKIGDIDHKMPKQLAEGYPYVSTKDFTKDFKISFDNAKYISEEDYLNLSRKIRPERGDIIFPRYGTIGKNILIDFDKEFLVSYSCAIIKLDKKKVIDKYAYLYSLSPKITDEIRKYVVETTQANIGIASIKSFVFPLSSLEEQTKVVQEIEKRLSVADKMEESIQQSLLQAESLRQSILKKAFEGGLVK